MPTLTPPHVDEAVVRRRAMRNGRVRDSYVELMLRGHSGAGIRLRPRNECTWCRQCYQYEVDSPWILKAEAAGAKG